MLWGVKWYYWLLLVLMCIAAIFVWQKALKASKARRERLKKEAEIWRRDFELRENYRELSQEIIFSAPTAELLHGVAMNIQIKLENAPNMEKAFNALPLEKKYIYTLSNILTRTQKRAFRRFLKTTANRFWALPPLRSALWGFSKYPIFAAKFIRCTTPKATFRLTVKRSLSPTKNSNRFMTRRRFFAPQANI